MWALTLRGLGSGLVLGSLCFGLGAERDASRSGSNGRGGFSLILSVLSFLSYSAFFASTSYRFFSAISCSLALFRSTMLLSRCGRGREPFWEPESD